MSWSKGLTDFVGDLSKAALPVVKGVYEGKAAQAAQKTAQQTALTQLKMQELSIKEAQLQKEAAQAAAANTSKFFSSKTVETIVIWTVTTIAGGVLVSVVMKFAGFR